MKHYLDDMGNFLWGVIIRAIIAFAICAVYALIHMAIFGRGTRLATVESLALLFGAIFVVDKVVNKISKRRG